MNDLFIKNQDNLFRYLYFLLDFARHRTPQERIAALKTRIERARSKGTREKYKEQLGRQELRKKEYEQKDKIREAQSKYTRARVDEKDKGNKIRGNERLQKLRDRVNKHKEKYRSMRSKNITSSGGNVCGEKTDSGGTCNRKVKKGEKCWQHRQGGKDQMISSQEESRKQESRKQESRKQESRKQESRKQESRKQEKKKKLEEYLKREKEKEQEKTEWEKKEHKGLYEDPQNFFKNLGGKIKTEWGLKRVYFPEGFIQREHKKLTGDAINYKGLYISSNSSSGIEKMMEYIDEAEEITKKQEKEFRGMKPNSGTQNYDNVYDISKYKPDFDRRLGKKVKESEISRKDFKEKSKKEKGLSKLDYFDQNLKTDFFEWEEKTGDLKNRYPDVQAVMNSASFKKDFFQTLKEFSKKNFKVAGVSEIPEIYRALKEKYPGITMRDFHEKLMKLWDEEKIILSITDSKNHVKTPELGINSKQGLLYFLKEK